MKMCSRSMLVATSAILAATSALADETQVATDEAKQATETQQVAPESTLEATNSVKAVRDKKTGKLRAPNAKERKEIEKLEAEAAAASSSSMPALSDTTITKGPSGTSSAMLGTEHLMSLHGERAEDGSIKKSHPQESGDEVEAEEWHKE